MLNQLLEAPGIQLDRQRRDGASPLWIACQTGHPEAVASLLQAGAQVKTVFFMQAILILKQQNVYMYVAKDLVNRLQLFCGRKSPPP